MRRALVSLLCITVLLAGGSRVVESRPQTVPEIQITQQSRALQPGEVVHIRVHSPEPVKMLEGRVFGKTFPFFPESVPTRWTGLVGIDLGAPAGTYRLSVEGTRPNGQRVAGELVLEVKPKEFPTRRLTVDEKFVNPPAESLDRIRRESERVAAIFAATTARRLWDGRFALPVDGKPTSSFGKRSILNGQPRSPHSGTDFDAGSGTPVHAPNAGRVVLADDLYYSGNTIIIDHGLGLYSYFAHLSSFEVTEGATVNTRDLVGRVGATGRVTGPHLHWSVRLVGTRVDPLSLVGVLQMEH